MSRKPGTWRRLRCLRKKKNRGRGLGDGSIFFPLICAYDGVKMPDHLRSILMETHPYVLVEEELVPSEQYSVLQTVLAAEESE